MAAVWYVVLACVGCFGIGIVFGYLGRMLEGRSRPRCTIYLGDETWHDGPGWYYVDDEYPEDGACGAFATSNAACNHAWRAGYLPQISSGKEVV